MSVSNDAIDGVVYLVRCALDGMTPDAAFHPEYRRTAGNLLFPLPPAVQQRSVRRQNVKIRIQPLKAAVDNGTVTARYAVHLQLFSQ